MTGITPIKSPVSKSGNVILEEELSCQLIIDAYKRDYGIDVSEYFTGIDNVKIYKCLDTKYRFYFPFSLAGKSNIYEELQKMPGYYELRLEHQIAESFFTPNESVLEIGCGHGLFIEKLQAKGISCTGLEFNQAAVKVGIEKGLNILSQDIFEHSKEHGGSYDIVYFFQVLEHITQVNEFLQACIDVLKVGGKLIVGVPNSNPFLYKYDKYHTLNLPPHHMGLWDTTALANLQNFFSLRLNGVLVEPLQDCDYDRYFKLQAQQLKSQSKLSSMIIETFLVDLRPTRIRRQLQKFISKWVPGRNLLAVYTKIL